MKIVFWGIMPGQAGCTANLLAVSLYTAMKYDVTGLLMQAHYNMNNLEAPLIGVTPAQTDMFQDVGIDALVRNIKEAPLTAEDFYNCSVSISKKLNLLTGTSKRHEDFYKAEMMQTFPNILHYAQENFDLVFIDTPAGKNPWVSKIVKDVDLLVVNLPQNKMLLDQFFKTEKFDHNKVFFLIGNYDTESSQSLSNLMKRYKEMDNTNTAFIPHNTDFMDAMSSGLLMDFTKKNINSEKEEENYFFMRCLADATARILKKVGIKGEMEDADL